MATHYPPSILRRCAARDLHRRFSILHGEIGHLLRSILQRQTHGQATAAETNRLTDEAAFLARLEDAAKQLKTDIDAALRNSRNQLNNDDVGGGRTLQERRRHRLLTDGQLFAIEQAAFRLKANVLSERIGNLHDRLDQFLERSNPDHPGPTRRRRSEQGIQDKYLSELSRWLYRDLARLASHEEYLNERYPYDAVPPVFQFWDYARASRHHSYITTEGYSEWRIWRDTVANSQPGNEAAPLEASKKFAALRLPYWIPECPELHPIIAHELAHQVLRDIYGYELHIGDLERVGGGVNRMLRRLFKCVEEWTAEVDESRGGAYRPLPIEILCDAMAASRCGVAYLYALYIEFLDNDVLADLAKDHTGMLEPVAAELSTLSERQDRSRDLFMQAETLIDRQVTWLLRISAVLGFVRKVFNPSGTELEFCEELETHLEELLSLYASGDTATPDQDPSSTAYYNHLKNFVRDIVHSLTTAGSFSANTPLMNAARKLWSTTDGDVKDYFLGKQMLGKAWKEVFDSQFPTKRSPLTNESTLTAIDLPWIGIWSHLQDAANTYNRLPNEMLNAIDAAREDYVFRTANPRAMFKLLGHEYRVRDHQPRVKTSALDESLHKIAHFDWIEALKKYEAHQSSQGTNAFSFEGSLFSIDGQDAVHTDQSIKVSRPFAQAFSGAQDVRRWFAPQARFRLDLLSITTNNKRGCYMRRDGEVVSASLEGLQVASQVLLGRYDAFALVPRREQDSPDTPAYASHSDAKYTSRSRNLVHTSNVDDTGREPSEDDVTKRAQNAVALVLVGLHWPGLRILFLHWIKSVGHNYPSLEIDTFLSDGWEDFTLVVQMANNAGGNPNAQLWEFARFVEMLNAHPFVTITETLFTARLLEISATDEAVDVTFNCRIGPLGNGFPSAKSLKSVLESKLQEVGAPQTKVQVSSVYGLTDYRVTMKEWQHLGDVGVVLECLYDIDSILRLDTRVSIKGE